MNQDDSTELDEKKKGGSGVKYGVDPHDADALEEQAVQEGFEFSSRPPPSRLHAAKNSLNALSSLLPVFVLCGVFPPIRSVNLATVYAAVFMVCPVCCISYCLIASNEIDADGYGKTNLGKTVKTLFLLALVVISIAISGTPWVVVVIAGVNMLSVGYTWQRKSNVRDPHLAGKTAFLGCFITTLSFIAPGLGPPFFIALCAMMVGVAGVLCSRACCGGWGVLVVNFAATLFVCAAAMQALENDGANPYYPFTREMVETYIQGLQGVENGNTNETIAANFTVSDDGSLVFYAEDDWGAGSGLEQQQQQSAGVGADAVAAVATAAITTAALATPQPAF